MDDIIGSSFQDDFNPVVSIAGMRSNAIQELNKCDENCLVL